MKIMYYIFFKYLKKKSTKKPHQWATNLNFNILTGLQVKGGVEKTQTPPQK